MPAAAQQVASLFGKLDLQDDLTPGLKKAGAGLKSFGKSLRKAGGQMRRVGRSLTTNLSLPLLALGGLAVKMAVDWESAFAGVIKTVDATEEELADLERGLRDLATSAESPVSSLENAAIQLAGIAELAGQLGVETSSILKFTEAMGLLGLATDLTGEEAAVLVAQIANITGLDFETELDGFTSALVFLGNNFATTESQILDMAQRIAVAANAIGLTEDQILALSAAVLGLGFAPERGGTNIAKFLTDLGSAVAESGDDLRLLSEIAGVEPTFFKELFETKPNEALLLFFRGLGDLPLNEQVQALDALGFSSTTLQQMLLALSGKTGVAGLEKAFDGAADAAERGTDAFDEGATRAGTAQSQFNLLKNKVGELATSIGEVLLPFFVDLLGHFTDLIDKANALNPNIIKMIVAFAGVLIIIGPVVTAVGAVVTALGLLTGPVGLAILAVAGLAAIWKTNLFGIRDATIEVVNKVIDVLAPLKEALTGEGGVGLAEFGTSLVASLQPVFDFLAIAAEPIKQGFGDLKEGLEGFFEAFEGAETAGIVSAVEALAPVVIEIGGALVVLGASLASTHISAIGDLLPKIGEALSSFVTAISRILEGDFSGALKALGGGIAALGTGLADFQLDILTGLVETLSDLTGLDLTGLSEVGGAILDGIASGITELGDWVKFEVFFPMAEAIRTQDPATIIAAGLVIGGKALLGMSNAFADLGGWAVTNILLPWGVAVLGVIGQMETASAVLGQAIIDGILEGLKGLGQFVADAITGELTTAGVIQAGFELIVPGGSAAISLFEAVTKDSGGPLAAGQPALIGTGAQPELFIPNVSGQMFPAGQFPTDTGPAPARMDSQIIQIVLDSQVVYEGVINEGVRRNEFVVVGVS